MGYDRNTFKAMMCYVDLLLCSSHSQSQVNFSQLLSQAPEVNSPS